MTIRVAIIEDHPLMRRAVERDLDAQEDIDVVATAAHGSKLASIIQESLPDVVVLDLHMSGEHFEPVSAVRDVQTRFPNVEIMVLTGFDDAIWIQRLIDAGANGYVLKSDDLSLCLPDGVRAVHAGRRFYSPEVTDRFLQTQEGLDLSDREIAILRMAAQGLANSRIAQDLGLSPKTVKNMLTSVYRKMKVNGDDFNSRVSAVNKARKMGLLVEGLGE